jgi:isoleucyl-tRNA synthetase
MISQPQWFLKISKIHSKILKENERTNWIPKWMRLRMKTWLKGISDWPVSRKRYWGTPLPIWLCENHGCGEKIVIGSIKELERLSGQKVREVHKPEIDKIKIRCKKCKSKMARVSEVLDVWFDSGVSSWAALETQKRIKEYWPADLNVEGRDQVRGWWNSQLILSEIKFNKKPFENILVHGLVLDLGKVKMSKSLGNIVSPQDVIKKYGRDFLRYYFAKTSKGGDFPFDEKEFKDIQAVFRILINVNNFINQLDKKPVGKLKIEDKWLLSRFNSVIKQTRESYNKLKFPEAVKILEEFLIKDLSKTYIQLIRERNEQGTIYKILKQVYINLIKFFAPICPFTTEAIWQELKKKKIVKEESVHLSKWPQTDKRRINKRLEFKFSIALRIIEKGLAKRDKLKTGLKWPLAKAVIYTKEHQSIKELKEIIARQLNVKKVEIKKGKLSVKLDTKLTPELQSEGYAREIARAIQAARKKQGLVKKDLIELNISGKIVDKIKSKKDFIKQRVNAGRISFNRPNKLYNHSIEGKIKNDNFNVRFRKK